MEGGERPQRHGDQVGDEEGQQGELEGDRQAAEQLGTDSDVVLERGAEIAAQHLAEPFEILDMQRPVEAVHRLEAGDRLRRRIDAERRTRRRARQHVDGDEQHDRRRDQRRDEGQQAKRQETEHDSRIAPLPRCGRGVICLRSDRQLSNQASFRVLRKPVRIGL